MPKTWTQKFESAKPPHIEIMQKSMWGMQPGMKLLISSPKEIEDFIRTIPAGKTLSVNDMKAKLSEAHQADGVCPLTTGIFLRIVAEKNYEDMTAGKPASEIGPFWRVIDPQSPLAKKVSFGAEELLRLSQTIG